MMRKVLVKQFVKSGAVRFNCDRSSPLGNPYTLSKDDSKRSAVCEAFREYLWLVIQAADSNLVLTEVIDPKPIGDAWDVKISRLWKRPTAEQMLKYLGKIKAAVLAGKDVELGCWCGKKQCHTETIMKCVEWRISNSKILVN